MPIVTCLKLEHVTVGAYQPMDTAVCNLPHNLPQTIDQAAIVESIIPLPRQQFFLFSNKNICFNQTEAKLLFFF